VYYLLQTGTGELKITRGHLTPPRRTRTQEWTRPHGQRAGIWQPLLAYGQRGSPFGRAMLARDGQQDGESMRRTRWKRNNLPPLRLCCVFNSIYFKSKFSQREHKKLKWHETANRLYNARNRIWNKSFRTNKTLYIYHHHHHHLYLFR